MANDVKIRFRSFLPGGGFDSAGGAKQGKTRVVGEIDVTSYVKGHEALSAIDVGLSAIDAISLRVSEETPSQDGSRNRRVVYSPSAAQFYLLNVTTGGIPVEYADAATETVQFVAEGDSAGDVELT